MGRLNRAAHCGEISGRGALKHHLAADRLEDTGLITKYRTYVGAGEHDYEPMFIHYGDLGWLTSNSHELRGCLSVVGLKLQGSDIDADPQALVLVKSVLVSPRSHQP